MIFADVHKPIYGLVAWTDSYGEGECFVLFYRSQLRRDKSVEKHKQMHFNVKAFEVKLPELSRA